MPPATDTTQALSTDNRQVLSFTVQYFKPSGKYYDEGKFDLSVTVMPTGTVDMEEVFDHLKQLQAEQHTGGSLPGLVAGFGKEFTLYVTHPEGYPGLIPPLVVDTPERKALEFWA